MTARKPGLPTLLGIPFDAYSSYLRGAGEAPPKIREALRCNASNSWSESGVDLGVAGVYADAGDLTFSDQDAFAAIEAEVGALLAQGKRPVSLGGDHSITYPIVKAFARRYPELTIFHFDAHPDLYDEFEGNRLSHACPFARIMEEDLAKRLVQVGIRTINRHQREQAQRYGVEVVEMRGLPAYEKLKAAGAVYITFDIARDGHPANVQVEQSSGVPSLDISAVRALQRIDTFGPLPQDYSGGKISVEYWFDYKK